RSRAACWRAPSGTGRTRGRRRRPRTRQPAVQVLVEDEADWHELRRERPARCQSPPQLREPRPLRSARSLPLDLLAAARDVRVDLGLVLQVEPERLVHERKRQRGKRLRQHLGRVPFAVEVDEVLDADAVPAEVDEAVRVLDEKIREIHAFASPPSLPRRSGRRRMRPARCWRCGRRRSRRPRDLGPVDVRRLRIRGRYDDLAAGLVVLAGRLRAWLGLARRLRAVIGLARHLRLLRDGLLRHVARRGMRCSYRLPHGRHQPLGWREAFGRLPGTQVVDRRLLGGLGATVVPWSPEGRSMRGNARVWGRMMLTAAVAASCQTADPRGVDRSMDVADAQDAGPPPASTSLVLRRVFPSGPGGVTPEWESEIDLDVRNLPAVRTLSIGPGDDMWIAGRFSAPLALGATTLARAGPSDVFVTRLDPLGRPRWARTLGGPGGDACGGTALDAEGNVIVAYQDVSTGPVMLEKLGPDGDLLWQKPLPTPAGEDFGGRVRAAGADRADGMVLVTSSVDDQFVVRLDPNGDVLWRTRVPLSDKDPVGVAVDGAGWAFVGAASTTGGSDPLLKVSPSGSLGLLARLHGTEGYAAFRDIAADP